MTLKDEWVAHCLRLSATPADLYSGCRKILRHRMLTFSSLDSSLTLADAGYTKNKLRMLEKNYLHVASRDMAVKLWEKRREQGKYGSVSFTTFNHLVKGDVKGATPRGSIFGPCLQSIVVTWLTKDRASVTVMYRTVEAFKKWAPDLVFIRDVLLPPFDFSGMKVGYRFFFANLTAHPLYIITLFPHLKKPIDELESLRKSDPFFHKWAISWIARFICSEHAHGIQNFSQALRVGKHAKESIDSRTLTALRKYVRRHHHRRDEITAEDDSE